MTTEFEIGLGAMMGVILYLLASINYKLGKIMEKMK
jgi:hypothetical protein